MSESQTAYVNPTGYTPPAAGYKLSDDLARLCLPQEWRDSYRRLAWVNSICALFLLVGLVGLKAPKVIVKPLSEIQDTVPVIFTPEEPPPPPPDTQPEAKPDEVPPETVNTPQVATVVAVADASQVSFPVPVVGANVVIAGKANLATAPPPMQQQPSRPSAPTIFNPNAGSEGSFPPPDYPPTAQRNRYQGTVIIEIKVDAEGNILSASIYKSSGYTILDEAALQVVTRRWRFAPGKERWLHWPCQFRMQ